MLLREISDGGPVSNLALNGLLYDPIRRTGAPILDDAQFWAAGGSAARVKDARTANAKTLITRALNTDNVATAPTPTYDTPAKKIVSFDAKVDVLLEDRNEDPIAELARQTQLEAEEAAWELQEMFFEGDDAAVATDFDGFRVLVAAGKGSIVANGVLVPVGGDAVMEAQQLAIEALLKAAATVRGGATHMYMNEFLKIRWLTVAKRLGYYNQIQTIDGMIETVGGIIIRGAGYNRAGTPLLPFTEPGSTSSIFFVRWGEGTNVSVLTSRGVVGRFAGQIGNHIINNVNMDAVLHVQDTTALVQSTGWKLTQP